MRPLFNIPRKRASCFKIRRRNTRTLTSIPPEARAYTGCPSSPTSRRRSLRHSPPPRHRHRRGDHRSGACRRSDLPVSSRASIPLPSRPCCAPFCTAPPATNSPPGNIPSPPLRGPREETACPRRHRGRDPTRRRRGHRRSCSWIQRILNSTISGCLNSPIAQTQLQMSQFGLPIVSVTEPLSLQARHASEVAAKMILMGHPVSSCHVPVVRSRFILFYTSISS